MLKEVTMLYYEMDDLEMKVKTAVVECNSKGAITSDCGLPQGAILLTVLEGECQLLGRTRQ